MIKRSYIQELILGFRYDGREYPEKCFNSVSSKCVRLVRLVHILSSRMLLGHDVRFILTNGWLTVQVTAPVDPRTPVGNRVVQGFSTAIMSPIQALVTSPLPAKRLYSSLCDESAPAAAQTRPTPKRSSAVR